MAGLAKRKKENIICVRRERRTSPDSKNFFLPVQQVADFLIKMEM